jgi:signal transduction histidine kinase/ligand-binding sensor domain-containing protein
MLSPTLFRCLLGTAFVLVTVGSNVGELRADGEKSADPFSRQNAFPLQRLVLLHESQKALGLARTPDGFIWTASDSGLLRYDGLVTRRYTPSNTPGLLDVIITALATDKDGSLWIGFGNGHGLSVLRNGIISPIPDVVLPEAINIEVLHASPDGTLWIGTREGLYSYRQGQPLRQVAHLKGTAIFAVEDAFSEGLWVATERGLFHHVRERSTATGDLGSVAAIAVAKNGDVFAAAEKSGLVRIDARRTITSVIAEAPGGIDPSRFTALEFDPDGYLWAGWSNGYGRIINGQLDPAYDTGRSTVDFISDRDGGMWAASYWGVVTRIARPFIQLQSYSENPQQTVIFGLAQSLDKHIWATHRASIVDIGGGETRRYECGKDIRTWCPRSVVPIPTGGVWLATCDEGLFRITSEGVQAVSPKNPESARALQTLLLTDDTLWIGGMYGELFRLTAGEIIKQDIANGSCAANTRNIRPGFIDECDYTITSMVASHDGGVWVGTRNNGVRYLRDGKVTVHDNKRGLPSNRILTLHESQDGTLWVGTQGQGLVRGHKGVWQAADRASGLPGQSVHGITEDQAGQLWLSTEEGVAHVPVQELNRFFADSSDIIVGDVFGPDESLGTFIPVQAYTAPIVYTDDDVVLVPTDQGLLQLDARRLDRVQELPAIAFDGIRIAGVEPAPATSAGEYNLPFGQSTLSTLEYNLSIPNFTMPIRVGLRYRLRGLDEAWRFSGRQRSITFRALPPGTYSLEVQATIGGQQWTPSSIGPTLRIRGFYQRPEFLVLLAFLGVLLWGLARLIRLQLKQSAFRKVLDERNRIARELHDSLAQYFTGISFQLERLRSTIGDENEDFDEIVEDTQVMLTRGRMEVRQAIHDLRSQGTESTPLFEALKQVTDEIIPGNGAGGITIQVEQVGRARIVATEIQTAIVRAAQQAIVNALAHAKASRIVVTARFEQTSIDVTIRDDGIGLPPGELTEMAMHYGMQGIQERAQALGGNARFESEQGQGTTVTISVPDAGGEKKERST